MIESHIMMWMAILVAFVLSLAAMAFVVWPLLEPGPASVIVEDDRLTELLGRKDAVLKAIKDLEFDYQVGKLSEEDFPDAISACVAKPSPSCNRSNR